MSNENEENNGCATCFGCLFIRHASSVIRYLRKRFKAQGSKYEIINNHKKGCNRFGEPCRWDEYVLIKKQEESKNDNEQ